MIINAQGKAQSLDAITVRTSNQTTIGASYSKISFPYTYDIAYRPNGVIIHQYADSIWVKGGRYVMVSAYASCSWSSTTAPTIYLQVHGDTTGNFTPSGVNQLHAVSDTTHNIVIPSVLVKCETDMYLVLCAHTTGAATITVCRFTVQDIGAY